MYFQFHTPAFGDLKLGTCHMRSFIRSKVNHIHYLSFYVQIEWCMYSRAQLRKLITREITLSWAHKQFVTRVHTLFYFLHDITNPKMTLKTRIFSHHPRASLARFSFCWWRHNRLAMTSQWPDHCDANTWQVISNSSYIDFIHGNIHGRSCKKQAFSLIYPPYGDALCKEYHWHVLYILIFSHPNHMNIDFRETWAMSTISFYGSIRIISMA